MASATSVKGSENSILDEVASLISSGGLGHAAQRSSPAAVSPGATTPDAIALALDLYASQFLPRKPRSLSGIALRSFLLGLVLSLSAMLSVILIYLNNPIWRAPFFFATLSIFHFLEFWTTARANTPAAGISSFLLSSNGAAYNIAHSCALLEVLILHTLFPDAILPSWVHKLLLSLGLLLIALGQGVRATAILTAGPSFSHIIAYHKMNTHVLITHGIYSVLRHPSYFGFFWWGIGTQLVSGNIICLLGYTIVLFWFFKSRIQGEEKLLVAFFGQKYVDYSQRTVVGIPGLG